jgi:UDP-2,3-diacylglucosamine hydrolase
LSAHYFVADLHLGAKGDEERRAQFYDFLQNIRGQAASLFIVGDLFEFGFEYRQGIGAANSKVAARLAGLVKDGTRVVLVKGNHDCWLGERFREEYGVEVHESPYRLELTERRAYLAHGDELDPSFKNQLFRRLFRSRLATRLFGLLPEPVGRFLALRVAGLSRVHEPDPELVRRFAEFASCRVAQGDELVVLAHVHKPDLRRYGSSTYLNPGDWITHFSFGVLDDAGVRLDAWSGRASPARPA